MLNGNLREIRWTRQAQEQKTAAAFHVRLHFTNLSQQILPSANEVRIERQLPLSLFEEGRRFSHLTDTSL